MRRFGLRVKLTSLKALKEEIWGILTVCFRSIFTFSLLYRYDPHLYFMTGIREDCSVEMQPEKYLERESKQ